MRLFGRRDMPPADVLALLERDERVVSWADTAAGGVVLATPRGLWWPDASGPRLIGWQFVDKAVWRDGVLSVIQADVVDEMLLVDRAPVHAELTTPRDLPPTVRKRVEANVVKSEVLGVVGGQARFVGRRVPGRDGVSWYARIEPGTVDSPQIRSAISARLAILRAEWDEEQRER